MSIYELVAEEFQGILELASVSVDNLVEPLHRAVDIATPALLSDNKILCCGNGPGAAVAQIFCTGLLVRHEHDRPALPAVSLCGDGATLSAIAASSHNEIFARQVRAIGHGGDVLLAVATNDGNGSIIQAIRAAHDRDMLVILLSGGDCNDVSSLTTQEDAEIYVDSTSGPRIIEMQTMIVHCLCKLIDQAIFGNFS